MILTQLLEQLSQAFPNLKIIVNNSRFDSKNSVQKGSLPMLEITSLSNEHFVYENEMVYPLKSVFQLIVTTENKKSNPELDSALRLAQMLSDACKMSSDNKHLYYCFNCIPLQSENVHQSKSCLTLVKRDLALEPLA